MYLAEVEIIRGQGMAEIKRKIVIVGGGTAGTPIMNHLARKIGGENIVLIEPSENHYYQPLWTLVGAGMIPRKDTVRSQNQFVPAKVEWVRDYASEFFPHENVVITRAGQRIQYEYLIVAPGIQIDYDKIVGLKETLGKNGVCCNYNFDVVDYTWEAIRNLKEGRALFTSPPMPIKCAGAPQKIMWLAEAYFRDQGRRDKIQVEYMAAGASIFGVAKYRMALEKLLGERSLKTQFRVNLVAIDGKNKKAIFRNLDTGVEHEESFDMIHVVPPMSAPDFVAKSPLANAEGWVDVDKFSLQHNKYPNIYAVGDASSLPTSRTGAAIRKQAPVLIKNLLAAMNGKHQNSARYNGYCCCPLVLGHDQVMLAEFDYDGNPSETFPFNQAKPRWSMYILKRYILPIMYWRRMIWGYFKP
jgi:sulfide:quinone oxidoreductase